ncbi:hypothetical protein ACFPRL_15985 [Pseudoclavibacter helvolus]
MRVCQFRHSRQPPRDYQTLSPSAKPASGCATQDPPEPPPAPTENHPGTGTWTPEEGHRKGTEVGHPAQCR